MTSAHYRTLRELCGLSQRDAAEFHDVAIRTIQHWESGRGAVPEGIAQEIGELNARIERAAGETMERCGNDPTILTRYATEADYQGSGIDLPWPSHNAMVGRVLLALGGVGVEVEVVWAGEESVGESARHE